MGRIIQAGDRAAVKARRTTTLAIPSAFADVTLDATDIENDTATVEHDNTNTDRITLVRDGLFWVHYNMNFDAIGVTNATAYIEARVRVNDTTVIDGSLSSNTDFDDNSIEGNDVQNGLNCGFLFEGSAGDFLTLQVQYTQVSSNDPTPDILAGLVFEALAQFN